MSSCHSPAESQTDFAIVSAGAFDAVAHPRPAAAVVLAHSLTMRRARWRQRPDIMRAHRGGCNRNPRTDVQLTPSVMPRLWPKLDHAGAVAAPTATARRSRASLLAKGSDKCRTRGRKGGIPERHGLRAPTDISRTVEPCKVAELVKVIVSRETVGFGKLVRAAIS